MEAQIYICRRKISNISKLILTSLDKMYGAKNSYVASDDLRSRYEGEDDDESPTGPTESQEDTPRPKPQQQPLTPQTVLPPSVATKPRGKAREQQQQQEDNSQSRIEGILSALANQIQGLSNNVKGLSNDVNGLSNRMDGMSNDTAELKKTVNGLADCMDALADRVEIIEQRQSRRSSPNASPTPIRRLQLGSAPRVEADPEVTSKMTPARPSLLESRDTERRRAAFQPMVSVAESSAMGARHGAERPVYDDRQHREQHHPPAQHQQPQERQQNLLPSQQLATAWQPIVDNIQPFYQGDNLRRDDGTLNLLARVQVTDPRLQVEERGDLERVRRVWPTFRSDPGDVGRKDSAKIEWSRLMAGGNSLHLRSPRDPNTLANLERIQQHLFHSQVPYRQWPIHLSYFLQDDFRDAYNFITKTYCTWMYAVEAVISVLTVRYCLNHSWEQFASFCPRVNEGQTEAVRRWRAAAYNLQDDDAYDPKTFSRTISRMSNFFSRRHAFLQFFRKKCADHDAGTARMAFPLRGRTRPRSGDP